MLVNSLTFRQDKLQGGVPITAKDTTHANASLYLICRFVPFEIQSVEGRKKKVQITECVFSLKSLGLLTPTHSLGISPKKYRFF